MTVTDSSQGNRSPKRTVSQISYDPPDDGSQQEAGPNRAKRHGADRHKEIREKHFSQRMGYGTRKILSTGDKLYWKRRQLSLTLACLFSIYTTLFRAFLTASRSAHMLLSWLSSSVVSDHHLCPFSGFFSIHHRSRRRALVASASSALRVASSFMRQSQAQAALVSCPACRPIDLNVVTEKL